MEKQQLKQTLKRLHAELEATGSADQELRQLLSKLDGDIHRLTEQPEAAAESFGERFESAAVDFEAEHPRIAMLLKELSDTLAKLGL